MAAQALSHVRMKSLGLEFSLHCPQPEPGNSFLCCSSMCPDPVRTSLTINTREKQETTASVPGSLLTLTCSGPNSSDFGVLEFLASFYSSVSNDSDEFFKVRWTSFSVHLCACTHTGCM